jgi:cell division GTPase FtsZ
VSGGSSASLYDVNEVASLVREEAHEDANIIFGAVVDEKLSAEIRVTVIATGLGNHAHAPEKLTSWCPGSATALITPDNGKPIEHLAEENGHSLLEGCSNQRNEDI